MNSKDKGNLGEALALAEFQKYNITTAIPFGDNARYDLIADFNGKLNKIQVKYCNQKISDTGSIPCPCASSYNHTSTRQTWETYENEIDYFVFYLAEWQKIILVPLKIIGNKKSIMFRQTKPKNNQSNYNLVDDYLFEKILN